MKLQLPKAVYLLLFLFAFVGVSNGQVTATYTFSVLGGSNVTNPSGNIDANISYTSAKNSGTTSATYQSTGQDLRLYYANTGSLLAGSSINLQANNGVTITGVEFESFNTSYMPTMKYSIGAAAFLTTDTTIGRIGATAVYTVSGLNVTTSMKIRNANTTNEQMRMMYIKVTYTPAGPTVTTTAATSIATTGATLNGTINANGVSTAASFNYGTTVGYGSTATASPSTATGTSATSISAAVTSLALNTQYHYRAVGTVSAVPTNGTDMTFYTLAATPGVLVVNNALQTTLDVTVNATTQNSNPAATTFAIREAGGQYVQANGTLGATEVWQTAATWGTKTVTGLATSTNYNFSAKAKNGANIETAFGTAVGGTTLAAQLVDFNKIQFPNTEQTLTVGGSLDVYTRAYEPGLTTNSGAQASLKGWVGYSSTNDNPANAGWTWVAATFNAESGDDDEYKATLSGLAIGTYYYAGRFQIGTGSYVYGGTAGNWNSDSVKLNVNPDVVDYANVFTTGSTTITQGETKTIFAQVYEPGVTPGAGAGAGITAQIGYSTSNTTPDGTWTWISAVYNVEVGNNDEYKIDLGTGLAPGTYYIASRFIKSGSSTYVYGGTAGIWNTDSVSLTVVADVVDFCNIQYPASGAITEGMSFDIYAQVYEAGVTNGAGQAAGITAQIGYSTTNGTPDGTWTWLNAAYHADGTGLNSNNDEYKVTFSGLAPGTYYYASRFIKTGSTFYVYGGTAGVWNNDSGVLTVNGLGTPVATAGTAIGTTSFTANWNAVTDATSYRLDVSTSPTFSESTSGSLNEGFENGLPTGSYVTTPTASTLDSGEWTLSNVLRSTTAKSGTYSMQLRSPNTNGIAISPSNANVTNLTFYARRGGSGLATTETEIYKIVSGVETLVSTIDLTISFQQFSIPINQIGEDVKIKFRNTGGNIALIDDVVINYGSTTASFVLGYEDLNVGNVTSYSVTGLDPETTYYYRVRAVLDAVISPNSNVIDVITTAAITSCTWDGSAWSNTVGPDATLDAFIEGAFTTLDNGGGFTAKSLTINAGGSLTISGGTNITVVEGLTNTLTAAEIVIESNANLLQSGSSNTNSGALTVKRNSAAIKRLDYTLWSSPVAGQGLYAFSPTTLPNRFYVYNPNTDLYSNAVGFDLVNLQYPSPLVTPNGVNGTDNNNVLFGQATGYLIRTPYNHALTATSWEGTFAGVANSGDITVSGLTSGLYYAVGNPYPSTIDADKFILDNSIGDDALTPGDGLYFWRKTNNVNQATNPTASYATYTTAGGVKSGGDSLDIVPSGVIQVGEGFIVKTTSTSLVFNNGQRIANNDDQFLRTTNSIERHRIWLNLSNATSTINQMMVSYMTGATQGVDASIDGRFFNDSPTALNSLVNNEEFSIQGRSLPFESTDEVALIFKTAIAGTYSIAIDHVDGLFSDSQDIFLRDTATGVEHDLRSSSYTFASEAGTFTNRFEIVYTAALSTNNPTLDTNSVVIYKNDNQSFVINTGNTTMSSVKVFDIRGRLLTSVNNINATQTIVTAGQSNEVLLVQVTSVEGATVTKKVVR